MRVINEYQSENASLYNGDCVEVMSGLPDGMVDFSIFSPPFSSLFVYSNSERDMGNCADDAEFFHHFRFAVTELFRITRPGRLAAVHCSQLPLHKYKDGVVGLKDFRGEIIRTFQSLGWIYHSEVCIWKDPVVEMQRTKALGLLHAQIKKDSSKNRVGMADYLCVFAKPGDNDNPVSHPNGFDPAEYVGEDAASCRTSIDVWQRYASPVWFDIRQTNVLNVKVARSDKDERHLCPLQLDVIERAIHLWTNHGDVVFTPFLGIGSEAYCALKMKRKAVGVELKEEYFRQAVKNCQQIEADATRPSLLDM